MSELMQYETSARFTAREKIALRYADAIMYDPAQADDALWEALRREFSEPELVELGYWIGFTFGGQRWLKTLSAVQGEFAAAVASRSGGDGVGKEPR
jgi:alkylhydroperoxidase family enzyme